MIKLPSHCLHAHGAVATTEDSESMSLGFFFYGNLVHLTNIYISGLQFQYF